MSNDARARQAMYMSKGSSKSSMPRGSGRAIMWLVATVLILGSAIWFLWSMF